jgi:hypothetical protein
METIEKSYKKFPASILSMDTESDVYKLWQLASRSLDEIKDIIQNFELLLSPDELEGAQLDRLGGIVLENREGRSDEDYRPFLKVSAGKNMSTGSIPVIIDFLRQLDLQYDFSVFDKGDYSIKRLDGIGFLDNFGVLDPGLQVYGGFEVIFSDTDAVSSFYLSKIPIILQNIKAGGPNGRIRNIFLVDVPILITHISHISLSYDTTEIFKETADYDDDSGLFFIIAEDNDANDKINKIGLWTDETTLLYEKVFAEKEKTELEWFHFIIQGT